MGHIGKDKRTKTKRLDRKESLDTIEEELENRKRNMKSNKKQLNNFQTYLFDIQNKERASELM